MTPRWNAGRWCLVALLVALSGAEAPPAKVWTEVEWNQTRERLRPGMTFEEVRAVLGPPRRIARQLLYQRYLEQWVYDAPFSARVEFDCQRGQSPFLLAAPPAVGVRTADKP